MIVLNENFLKNSPCGVKNREIIEILFEFQEIIQQMDSVYADHKAMHLDIHSIHFSIQEAFGFPQNKDFHRFWEWGCGCTCPMFDNLDTWGLKIKYYAANCEVHSPIL